MIGKWFHYEAEIEYETGSILQIKCRRTDRPVSGWHTDYWDEKHGYEKNWITDDAVRMQRWEEITEKEAKAILIKWELKK